jgi:hypothetical protein
MNEKPPQKQFKEGLVDDEEEAVPVTDQPPELEEPQEELLREKWPIKVRLLHKPVRNNKNDMVHELSFREPTGGDINRYGNPVRIDQNGDVLIDEKKMTTMMAVLSGVLMPFLEGMDPRDWNSAAYRLRNFFLPDPAAW